MKRKLQFFITASAVSAFACSVPAQDKTTPKTETNLPDPSRQESVQDRGESRLNGAAKASELIGMDVKNYQDEKLGTVEDLGVDMESGRVVHVILSSGGFIGIGSSLTAVPPGALHHDTAKQELHLNADKAKLESAPKFDADKWAESSSSTQLAAIYRHYGEESAFNFIDQGAARREGQPDQTDRPGQSNEANRLNQPNQADRTAQPGQAADARRVVTGSDAQTLDSSPSASERQAMIPAERLAKLQRASEVLGMTVKNRQDETLGDVDNILVDLPSGRLVAVVLSTGGFLGLGDELSAVPPTALRFSADRADLQLDATKEKLGSAPHFKANEWPDFAQPEEARGVYLAYQVEPYFGTDKTAGAADNTKRNMRDRNDQNLTPLDQGNSPADIETTASIRMEIGAHDTMSVNAKNVKIITKDGRVTLRGPVNSAEEKRLIGEIANRIATAANVDNQLEVKVTTSGN